MNLDDTIGELTVNVRGYDVDLRLFMEQNLWIFDKNGKLIPLKLNYEQQRVYREMCDLHHRGEPMFIDILKARQMGMSTFIAGVFFTEAMFSVNSNYAVIADIKEHAENIYEKYTTFYKYLNHSDPRLEDEINRYEEQYGRKHEADLRPTLSTKARGRKLATLGGNSSITVLASDNASGRSSTLQGFHASEVAFWKSPASTFTSINSTVSLTNPNAMVFIETTANGFNEYKTIWDKDMSGRSGRSAVFIPWFTHGEYHIEEKNMPRKMPVMEEWVYQKLKEHPEIGDEQILWYWRVYNNHPSKADMLQEYPFDPMDAFKSSGFSTYDMDLIAKRKNEVTELEPIYGRFYAKLEWSSDNQSVKVTDKHFEECPGSPWKIFQKPVKGEPYVAICDPTKGFNADWSAIQVFDNITGHQVAVYHSKSDDLDEVGKQLMLAGYYYNNALISSENNTGPKVLEMAVKAKYPKIYMQQEMIAENLRQGIRPIPGHNTNRGNRSAMIADSRIQFKNDPECICDYETLTEMETFQIVEHNGTFREEAAGKNFHDDLIMAWVPFSMVRTQQSFVNDGKTTGEVKTYTLEQLNEMMMRRKRNDEVEVDDYGIEW